MFRIIKEMSIVLLTGIANVSNHIKCVSLSNQKLEIETTLSKLHCNVYSQELQYYLFSVKLHSWVKLFMTYKIRFKYACF